MTTFFRRTMICAAMAAFTVCALAQTTSNYEALVQKGKEQLQAGNADLALVSGKQAIGVNASRWEAYALVGGALMNEKSYEGAADNFSQAIARAPESKQQTLRELRRQCLLAESGVTTAPNTATDDGRITEAEIVLWKSIENSTNPADFESYLGQYPHGAFVALARRHLAESKIEAQQVQQQLKQQEIAAQTWTDSSTGLMWLRKAATREPGLSFGDAQHYCETLQLLGYSGWRLPSADEVSHLFLKKAYTIFNHAKIAGDIQMKNTVWTTTPGKKAGTHDQITPDGFRANDVDSPTKFHHQEPLNGFADVLCVRSSGDDAPMAK